MGDVWGVGRRISAQLIEAGITNALELSSLDPATVKARWSVVLERTVRELQGMQCIDFEDCPDDKKQIACTRSFGQPVTQRHHLQEALSEFSSRAAEKLRKKWPRWPSVGLHTYKPIQTERQTYSRSAVVPLPLPTADTAQIAEAAIAILHAIYKPNFNYARAGIMLLDLQPATRHQYTLDLEDESFHNDARERLMQTLDGVNKRYGRGTIKLARAGAQTQHSIWQMKQQRKTPSYTTNWNELGMARA